MIRTACLTALLSGLAIAPALAADKFSLTGFRGDTVGIYNSSGRLQARVPVTSEMTNLIGMSLGYDRSEALYTVKTNSTTLWLSAGDITTNRKVGRPVGELCKAPGRKTVRDGSSGMGLFCK